METQPSNPEAHVFWLSELPDFSIRRFSGPCDILSFFIHYSVSF